jgi:hypothetical protein
MSLSGVWAAVTGFSDSLRIKYWIRAFAPDLADDMEEGFEKAESSGGKFAKLRRFQSLQVSSDRPDAGFMVRIKDLFFLDRRWIAKGLHTLGTALLSRLRKITAQ